MEQIFRKLKKKNIHFDHACEVGVYTPGYSNIIDFIKTGIKTTLVEADSSIAEKLREYFKGYKNVTIHGCAIWDYNGTVKLYRARASTFVSQLTSSPALANDAYMTSEGSSFEMECRVFSEIDDGTIDLLSIDIEGSEWYVLKHIRSSPKIISVETHGRHYINPFIDEIKKWTRQNNYVTWYKNVSDTVFVRKDVFSPTISEKCMLKITGLGLAYHKLRRSIFK